MYNCGGYYRGQWTGDLMHGSGILETKDGSVYDGEFVGNKVIFNLRESIFTRISFCEHKISRFHE